MAQPGDDGRLRPSLDGDAFRSGDRAAANRCRMVRNSPGQPLGEIGMDGMKGQKCQDGGMKVLDVSSLCLFATASVGGFAFCELSGRSLGFKFRSNSRDRRCRRP